MQAMKFFMDTHDQAQQTFPAELTTEQFQDFLANYEQACLAEDVVLLRVHVAMGEGRAFGFTIATGADT
jgi:hypothetical protein